MTEYVHPYRDATFVLEHLVNFDGLCADNGFEDASMDLLNAILDEAGKLASEELSPLNRVGDTAHPQLGDNGVQETAGFGDFYRQFQESGWTTLTGAEIYGGQNQPNVVGTAVNEIWQSANLSFGLCPLLTQGSIESLKHHGSDELKNLYLPKLISGEWTGTMNLTESDAGTDLAALKSKAIPEDDHYLISGQKIFITWGDHQMTENIVHLVLARLPDAPVGVKGISLFIVPKFMPTDEGVGDWNNVQCLSLEHKMGIHGSPTCVMKFDRSKGYLVGEAHNGLAYMFTMMNHARQAVGLQGLAISERAYQDAVAYAKEREQGTRRDGSRFTIINFPDVRRMLMQMKSSIEAMRALAYVAAAENDRGNQSRTEVYTPIVKGWMTEMAQELTSLAVQVHGGMGFIEETGVAQHQRDARILPIYEGTNGVQALDLVGRKTLHDKGQALTELLDEIAATIEETKTQEGLSTLAGQLNDALKTSKTALEWLLDEGSQDLNAAFGGSFHFMMMAGYLCGGWMMLKSAAKAGELISKGEGDSQYLQARQVTARFYGDYLLPRVAACAAAATSGADSIMALTEEQF